MTEAELQNFVDEHKEGTKVEYKLKPNFNDTRDIIEYVRKKRHFNILKTIYAFANTDGGTLYIGVGEPQDDNMTRKKRVVVGVDDCDMKLIEGILTRVDKKITRNTEIVQLENKRKVMKIIVEKLKSYDKPLHLDGVFYFRKNDSTHVVKFFAEAVPMYKKDQFYLFLLKGVESNLCTIKEEEDNFMIKQFIDGLKNHIKLFANTHNITDKETINKAEQLLDEIQKEIKKTRQDRIKSLTDVPDISTHREINIDELIDKFIQTYKIIIEMGV